jgi:tRNA pseudouridine38-40 synthase
MARYQVILAYDGTEFRGSQRQARRRKTSPEACEDRTVQGVFEAALRQLGWRSRSILSAGRTDSGVHASGQVFAFDLDWEHPPEALQAALNACLPTDVAVQTVQVARPGFHPRYDAAARRYGYRIYCQSARDPLRDRYAWRVWPAVTLESLQEVARLFPGTHDFAAFGTPPWAGGSTLRTVYEAGWVQNGPDLSFEVAANAFLYRMVRRMVFTQVLVAQGRLEVQVVAQSLQQVPQQMFQGLAPPQGLTLLAVVYPAENGPDRKDENFTKPG